MREDGPSLEVDVKGKETLCTSLPRRVVVRIEVVLCLGLAVL